MKLASIGFEIDAAKYTTNHDLFRARVGSAKVQLARVRVRVRVRVTKYLCNKICVITGQIKKEWSMYYVQRLGICYACHYHWTLDLCVFYLREGIVCRCKL